MALNTRTEQPLHRLGYYRCGCGAMGRDDVPLKVWPHAPGCNMLSLDVTLTQAASMLIASIEEDDDER